MKKALLGFAVILLILFGFIFNKLNEPNLTLYPKLNGKDVELYLLKKKFNIDLVDELLVSKPAFLNISITDGKNSKSTIINFEKLDLKQISCKQKWSCPVVVLSKKKFEEKFLKSKTEAKNKSITDRVFESDITKDVIE